MSTGKECVGIVRHEAGGIAYVNQLKSGPKGILTLCIYWSCRKRFYFVNLQSDNFKWKILSALYEYIALPIKIRNMAQNHNNSGDYVTVNGDNDKKGPSLKKLLSVCIASWRWVIASVIFFVGVSILYILITTPVYERTTYVAIKQDSDGNSTSRGLDVSGAFSGMGFFKNSSILENEIAMLESPDLMENVVSQLRLNIQYTQREGLRNYVLYGIDQPIEVEFDGLPEKEVVSLKIRIKRGGKITLYDMKNNTEDKKKEYKDIIEASFNKAVKTPIGTLTIKPTPFFKPSEELTLGVSRTSIREAAEEFNKAITISHKEKDGTVVDISIEDPNEQRADAILNSLIDCYNRDWIEEKNLAAITTTKFINERLAMLETELGEVDSNISSYLSENMIPNLGLASSMAMQENHDVSRQLVALTNQLMISKYLKDYIDRNAKGNDVLPVNTGVNNEIIENQLAQYNTLVMQRASMYASGNEGHPDVENIDLKIETMRHSLLMAIDNQINTLTMSIRASQGFRGDAAGQIGSSPEQSRYLNTIGRDQKVKENLYVYLLQKREENELSQSYTSPNTRMVRRPSGLNKPIWPRPLIILAFGFLLGILCPMVWIYFKLSYDNVIHTREDLISLRAPIVGDVPLAKPLVRRTLLRRLKYLIRKLRGKENIIQAGLSSHGIPQSGAAKDVVGKRGFEYQGILVKSGDRDVMNEAFRVLRTNLRFMSGRSGKKTGAQSQAFSLTSFSPGSGKTFVAVNLGCALALKGDKVLLIDADMRRATLSTFAGSPQRGLSNYLSEETDDVASLIKRGTDLPDVPPTLDLLPAGTIPPNPTELLESGRLEELITELKNTYDYILIDCPPAEGMADAKLIDEVIDRTIFVVRYGLLAKDFINVLNDLYSSGQYSNLSVILNGSVAPGNRYGNSYGSYSNYSY